MVDLANPKNFSPLSVNFFHNTLTTTPFLSIFLFFSSCLPLEFLHGNSNMNVFGLFTTSISWQLNAMTDGYLSCSY